jgi:nitrogenase molybdenum-iron protein beta chain
MSQTVDNIKPSYPVFREDEYKENLGAKQERVEVLGSRERRLPSS